MVLLALLLLARAGCRAPGPGPILPDTIPEADAIHGRPEPRAPRGVGGVVAETVTVVKQVTRTFPDTQLAGRYARLALAYAKYRHEVAESTKARRARGDSTPVSRETPPPEVLPPMALSYSGKQLTLWLTPSSGRLAKFTTRVQPHWTAVAGRGGASDERPIVVQDRAWVRTVREIRACAPPGAAGALIGALAWNDQPGLGAGAGALLGELACLWD